ncbi:MAG: hypothetical protein AAF514_15885, partial [Verrucomicrobiota bacterium]
LQAASASSLTSSATGPLPGFFLKMSSIKTTTSGVVFVLALAFIPIGWQRVGIAKEQRRLQQVESENVALRVRAELPARPGYAVKTSGASALFARPDPTAGRASGVDLEALAEQLHQVEQGRNLTGLARLIRLSKSLRGMPEEEARALCERMHGLTLSPEKRKDLQDFILDAVKDRYPALAVGFLAEQFPAVPTRERDQAFRILKRALGSWAMADPSAARVWYERATAEGLFESRGVVPLGVIGERSYQTMAATQIFQGLLSHDVEGAEAFYHTHDTEHHEGMVADASSPEHREFLVGLAREIPNSEATFRALKGILYHQVRNEGLSTGLYDSIVDLELDREIQNDLVRETVKGHVRSRFFKEAQPTDELLDDSIGWIGDHVSPEEADRMSGEMLAGLEGLSRTRPVAEKRFDEMQAAGASDQLALGYLVGRNSRIDLDRAFEIVAGMRDPALREKALVGIAEPWVGRLDQLMKARAGSTIPVEELSRALAGIRSERAAP